MFLCPPWISLQCWLPRWWTRWPVSPTYCSLHLLHSMRYITLLVLYVVCCRSVIFSNVVLLLAVPVNSPYVLQHWHRISALQGQNPGWVSCHCFCCLGTGQKLEEGGGGGGLLHYHFGLPVLGRPSPFQVQKKCWPLKNVSIIYHDPHTPHPPPLTPKIL